MKTGAEKWADIAAPNSSTMKSKVSKFVDDVSGEDQRHRVETFMDRAEELGRKHKVNMYQLLSYMLAPLTDTKVEEPELDAEQMSSLLNEEEPRPKSRPLKGQSREQVVSICNRHGLRTLDQLLLVIDRLAQAQKGSLQQSGEQG